MYDMTIKNWIGLKLEIGFSELVVNLSWEDSN